MMREAMCQQAEKTIGGYNHHEQTMRKFKTDLETIFRKSSVGLLVFVLRHGQETDIEIDAFRFIIDRLQNSVSECSALVVTGCDVLSKKAKETYKSSDKRCCCLCEGQHLPCQLAIY